MDEWMYNIPLAIVRDLNAQSLDLVAPPLLLVSNEMLHFLLIVVQHESPVSQNACQSLLQQAVGWTLSQAGLDLSVSLRECSGSRAEEGEEEVMVLSSELVPMCWYCPSRFRPATHMSPHSTS